MLNFISLEEGHNYLCINDTETGPLELKNLPGTKYNFFSPNNQYFYTSIGVCCLTATNGFHIISEVEQVEEVETEHYPNFACSDCGNTDKDRFRSIRAEDGTEYDLECTVCGSLETEESPEMALHRMAVKLENCQSTIRQIEEIINLGLPTDGMYGVYNRFKKINHILKDNDLNS